METALVLVTEELDPECAAWLGARSEVAMGLAPDSAAFREALGRAGGLVVRTYTRVDSGLLERAPGLRVVARAGVGLENVDVAACRARGVEVVYAPDANTQAVVEYVFALVLNRLRPLHFLDAAVGAGEWTRLRRTDVAERQLSELTLGILGLGRIGLRVGAVAAALGMKVLGHDLLPREEIARRARFELEQVPQAEVLDRADVLTLHVDGRPANRDLIDGAALARLKPGCLLLNTSRGMVVNPQALAEWSRRVLPHGGAAILDVHEPEPVAADSPLLGLPNVRLAPHLASRTRTALRNMGWVVKDVIEVLEGRAPRYPAPR